MKRLLTGGLLCSTLACVWISRRVDVQNVDPRDATTVTSPVKAHLRDGSTVLYANGVTVSGGMLRGAGVRHDLTLATATKVENIRLDDVVGMETFRTQVNQARTFIISTLVTVGGVVGGVLLAKAIFGSCPTVYSGPNGEVAEAELFSTSIAPLFEGRDLDRLRAQSDSDDALRLELRNEAMETHYLNHLQLLEVLHSRDEFVLPDPQGSPLIVGGLHPPEAIRNREGRDLQQTLSEADGVFYRTELRRINSTTAQDMDDWIDVSTTVPAGSQTATLVFRMRNSLLGTVLLYDVMLGPAGAAALNWLGTDLSRISTAVELGRWHQRRAGLHIAVLEDGEYREVARLADSGPISWHDVAAAIPVPRGQTALRLRLSYLADHWRIDRVAVASTARQAIPRTIDIARVTASNGQAETEALENLRDSDERYLQTSPGQRFFARFDVGPAPADGMSARTFLLSSQGYYTEWIRGAWIRHASVSEPFVPTDASLITALRKWGTTRESFERSFVTRRVPVH